MTQSDNPEFTAFTVLFKEVCAKCFGHSLEETLTESQSRHLSFEIEEKTGLVIGWKSLKNYAGFVLDETYEKQVNPTPATLDTLARYVFEAEPITEEQRRRSRSSYSYWFRYKERFPQQQEISSPAESNTLKKTAPLVAIGTLTVVLAFIFWPSQTPGSFAVSEDFTSLEEHSMHKKDWLVISKKPAHWNRRDENPGRLTLFTLQGDSWPDKEQPPVIHNLLARKIPKDHFSAEVHFSDFRPRENWQQAGLILLEDTTYTGKSIRLSLAYNDYFGGYSQPGEILIQAIASYGKAYQNVEEIVHQSLFVLDGETDQELITRNLKHSAVRIEKQGDTFRFLYSTSPLDNFSFKELAVYDFDMAPKYTGIFALKGFVDSTSVIPVAVQYFRLESLAGN